MCAGMGQLMGINRAKIRGFGPSAEVHNSRISRDCKDLGDLEPRQVAAH